MSSIGVQHYHENMCGVRPEKFKLDEACDTHLGTTQQLATRGLSGCTRLSNLEKVLLILYSQTTGALTHVR